MLTYILIFVTSWLSASSLDISKDMGRSMPIDKCIYELLADSLVCNQVTCENVPKISQSNTSTVEDVTATLVLQKTVDNINPTPGEPFNYTIDVACNSTSRDCESVIITDCLDADLTYLNVSDPLPDGVSSAIYDPATHCITITFDATNCTSCSPDGINTDNDDFAQGSSVQLLIQVMFPVGTFTGTTADNTVTSSSDNAGNPSDSSQTVTVQGGSAGASGCDAIPAYANISGSNLVQGGQWQGRVRATNLSTDDIDDFVITTTIPDNVTFTHIIGPDLESGLCTDIDVYYERSDMPGVFIFHTTMNSCSSQNITLADLGLPPGIEPIGFQFDYGSLEGDGSWNPDTWTRIFDNEIRIFGTVDTPLPLGTPVSYCNTVEGIVAGDTCMMSQCDAQVITEGSNSVGGDKVIFDTNNNNNINDFAIGETYRVGLTYSSPDNMFGDLEGAYLLDILPDCMEYVPGSWYIAWGGPNINNQVPVVNTGYTPEGRQYVEFVWDESLGNNFIIPGTGVWTAFQVRFDVKVTGSCSAGEYINDYYLGTTGNDSTTDCGVGIAETNLSDFANAATYVTNGELCHITEDLNIIIPPGSAGLDSHKASRGSLDTEYNTFPDVGQTYASGEIDYRLCLENSNPVPVEDLVIIDIFPYLGDTEILNPNIPRGSEWAPTLAAPIIAPPGITVQYTTVSNPCTDELAGSQPTPFPTGCNPAGWSSTPPSDLSTVTGIRIDGGNTILNQNEQFCIEFMMNVPEGTVLNSSAHNSFAFVAKNANTGSPLLPSEPIKVGIDILPPPCEIMEVDLGPIVTFCEGENETLNPLVSFGLEPFTYDWTGPDGFISNVESPTVSVSGTYTLTVTDATGCMVSDQTEVFAFTCNQTTNCNFLDDFSSGSFFGSAGTLSWSNYSWDETGDNNIASSGDVAILGGVLMMENSDATPPAIQRRLDLSGHSSAVLSFDFWGEGDLTSDDEFIIEVFDGTTWTTIFTYNGAISGTLMPSFDISAYISEDTEIRISIVSGFEDSGERLLIDNVRIDADCLCDGIADAGADASICDGDDIQLSGSGGLTYDWSPATGLSDTQIADPIASPTETTTYQLTVTDEFGCTDTDEVTVTVYESLLASITPEEHDYCEDGSGAAILTLINGTAPFTITWNSIDGSETGSHTMSSTGSLIISELNGNTTYCFSVTDSNGCGVDP